MIKDITRIYDALQDEESRYIFRQRLLYSITENDAYIYTMVHALLFEGHFGIKGLSSFAKKHRKAQKSVILFGAGFWARQIYPVLRREGFVIDGICDNYLKALPAELADIPLISIADMGKNIGNAYIIILPDLPDVHQPIFAQLIAMGFNNDDIFIASMHDDQYFNEAFMNPRPNEVFIDAGSYTGDTIKAFHHFCHGDYSEIYSFEPNPDVQEGLQKTLARLSLHDTEIFKRGAWSSETALRFAAADHMGGRVENTGNTEIQTKTIDSIQAKNPITLIKMDIEGAEMEALKGAKETIQRDHPRLAICVYHKPEDIIDIPEYILSLNPDYKLYLRHYSYISWETVVYALP